MASTTNLLLLTLFVLQLVTITTSTSGTVDNPSYEKDKPENDSWLHPWVRGSTIGAAPAPAPAPGPVPLPSRKYGKRSLNPRKIRDRFCMPKSSASDEALQKNIDYVCKRAIDCKPVQPGGVCYEVDNSIYYRAAYLMHMYYNINGRVESACDFFQTGNVTNDNPTKGNCIFK